MSLDSSFIIVKVLLFINYGTILSFFSDLNKEGELSNLLIFKKTRQIMHMFKEGTLVLLFKKLIHI